MYKLLLLLIIIPVLILLTLYYITRKIREDFMVEGAPLDIRVKKDASKAYYNEMSNAEFEKLLQTTFPYPCYRLSIAGDETKWKKAKITDKDDNRDQILENVINRINKNRSFDDLNLVSSPEFQLVDYKVINKWRHNYQPWFYKYEIKAVLYREGKYHGKQVLLTALLRGSVIDIVQISVTGVIFEDRIALYPVSGTDSQDIPESDSVEYQKIIFDNEDAQAIIDKQTIAREIDTNVSKIVSQK